MSVVGSSPIVGELLAIGSSQEGELLAERMDNRHQRLSLGEP